MFLFPPKMTTFPCVSPKPSESFSTPMLLTVWSQQATCISRHLMLSLYRFVPQPVFVHFQSGGSPFPTPSLPLNVSHCQKNTPPHLCGLTPFGSSPRTRRGQVRKSGGGLPNVDPALPNYEAPPVVKLRGGGRNR